MSPEMKNYIENLKADGDFRPEGLSGYYKAIPASFVAFAVFYIFPYVVWDSLVGSAVAFFVIMGSVMFWHCLLRGPHWLYNKGGIAYGRITSASYLSFFLPVFFGWAFHYQFEVSGIKFQRSEKLPKGKYYHFLGRPLPHKYREIIIFYDKSNPKKSMPLVPLRFSDWCLSQSRYDKYMPQQDKGQ